MEDTGMPRRTALAAGLAAATGLAPRGAVAQQYPNRPIRWIVGYAPGGGVDTLARLLAAVMSPRLGQPVLVENRPGAATNIGAEAAAKAPPDGHTVFTADNATLVFNPVLYKRLPFDPDRDFRLIGLLARSRLVLSARQGSAFATAQDLVDRARAAPGAISYGSSGIGSSFHITMERLAREAGVRLNHTPYRGMAPVLNDLMAGTVEVAIIDYPTGAEVLRSGHVKPLAVTSAERMQALPDVPTVQEALGLRGFEAYAWQGLVVPARTPDAIAARLTGELTLALGQDAFQAWMRQRGSEPLAGGPAEFQALIEAERAVWVPLIRDLGIALD
jgi:tripartite-type tricarboxylate transporter receptor subunit TctC